MGPILIALVPLVSNLVAGESITAALSGLSIMQWATLAGDLISAAPQEVAAIKALHPALKDFATDVLENAADHMQAARSLHAWLQANTPKTISGYVADGAVTSIANPDAK